VFFLVILNKSFSAFLFKTEKFTKNSQLNCKQIVNILKVPEKQKIGQNRRNDGYF